MRLYKKEDATLRCKNMCPGNRLWKKTNERKITRVWWDTTVMLGKLMLVPQPMLTQG